MNAPALTRGRSSVGAVLTTWVRPCARVQPFQQLDLLLNRQGADIVQHNRAGLFHRRQHELLARRPPGDRFGEALVERRQHAVHHVVRAHQQHVDPVLLGELHHLEGLISRAALRSTGNIVGNRRRAPGCGVDIGWRAHGHPPPGRVRISCSGIYPSPSPATIGSVERSVLGKVPIGGRRTTFESGLGSLVPLTRTSPGQASRSHPCRMAYLTISIRPLKSSLRIAFALWASTVFTLRSSCEAISLLL